MASDRSAHAHKNRNGLKVALILLGVLVAAAIAIVVVNPLRVRVVLDGDRNVTVNYGEEYKELGAEAYLGARYYPKHLADLEVTTYGNVDTSKIGTYEISYSAKWWYFSGKTVRRVQVVDANPPQIALNGEQHIALEAGTSFEDPGVCAQDDVDGDLTTQVNVQGEVDMMTVGEYTLTYTVSDASGNTAETTRTVTVEPVKQKSQVNPGHKVVYLTFDDGPSKYTPKLLDVLKSHNVHATFFVTGNGDRSIIARAAAEGNAIGVHTMSHNYEKIYSSKEAYLADFNAINDVIEAQTGKRAEIFRFPGGSSNTVSSFNSGIMTTLSTDMQNLGYRYFDWNVSSGDAGGVNASEAVYDNVIKGIQSNDVSVVLQHDTQGFSVEAVDKIITWGLSNGYTFLPLDVTSPGMHHPIAN
ncbi:MAG: polysaccharide deacetylase family protein [Actinomycetaceae bacterium]|nr:polysaccharide deacetylase family protein [Arcanobacterium sp.]MDD7504709.1 polysaccharide deacetylase family protein [Actinomycetaceae bacterium]MDY6143116.1 polysaccharide deacetylase family protein [Arcanobacterium sp.]